ncbi:hypothetical protein CYY_007846 [Polysphondylium violaceum]|uniref:Uncharacterized protein n=1 Tax=Polysphondylium violaceum TaxID=133409 RepID=A0A8J4PN17_9MYCE|nr:hypothetical protein CYY_007846 [Polysphondylium violaceum]
MKLNKIISISLLIIVLISIQPSLAKKPTQLKQEPNEPDLSDLTEQDLKLLQDAEDFLTKGNEEEEQQKFFWTNPPTETENPYVTMFFSAADGFVNGFIDSLNHSKEANCSTQARLVMDEFLDLYKVYYLKGNSSNNSTLFESIQDIYNDSFNFVQKCHFQTAFSNALNFALNLERGNFAQIRKDIQKFLLDHAYEVSSDVRGIAFAYITQNWKNIGYYAGSIAELYLFTAPKA